MKKYSALSKALKEEFENAVYEQELKSTSYTLKHKKYRAYLWSSNGVEYLIVMDTEQPKSSDHYFIPDELGDSSFLEYQ